MKAASRKSYGLPDVIKITQREKPIPGPHEVLIQVYATTVNRTDCAILTGEPWIMRLFTGVFVPSHPITGTDFAGIIVAVGNMVTVYKPGDRVMGFNDLGLSSHAEYLTIGERKPMVKIPPNIDFAQAAASLEGVHYAVNFINKINLKPGQKALVNGATGSIGISLVQFLKQHELYVTAVCKGLHKPLLESLGANKVIDYTISDFTHDSEKYDYVFDAVGKSRFMLCKHLLKLKGIYISSELGPGAENPFLALKSLWVNGQRVIFPIPYNIKASLNLIKELLENGQFIPIVDKQFPLEKIADAYRYVATGEKIGNVVISIKEEIVETGKT